MLHSRDEMGKFLLQLLPVLSRLMTNRLPTNFIFQVDQIHQSVRSTHTHCEEVNIYVFYQLGEAVSVATSSAVNVGYPGRCHPCRQIQMDVASYVY